MSRTVSAQEITMTSAEETTNQAYVNSAMHNAYGQIPADYTFFVRVLTTPYPISQFGMKAYYAEIKASSQTGYTRSKG